MRLGQAESQKNKELYDHSLICSKGFLNSFRYEQLSASNPECVSQALFASLNFDIQDHCQGNTMTVWISENRMNKKTRPSRQIRCDVWIVERMRY